MMLWDGPAGSLGHHVDAVEQEADPKCACCFDYTAEVLHSL